MSEYDDLIAGSMQPNPAQAARVGFTAAVDSNPDSVAEARRVAQRTGVPIDTVLNMPVEMKRQDRIGSIDFDTLAQTSPSTAALLADVDKAPLLHDNVDSMSGIEQAFQVLKNTGNAAVSGLRSASAGSVGLLRAPFDVAATATQPLVGNLLPANPFGLGAEMLGDWQTGISGRAKAEMPKGDSVLSSGVYGGIASLSRNLATLPLAFMPGGQGAALGAMVAPVFGEGYGEARDTGKSIAQSTVFGGSQAAIEYATEKLPLSWLLKDVKAGTGFLKTLGKQAVAEVPGEQIATVLQDLNEWAVINPDKPFSDYIAERPNAAAQTLIATLVGVGGQTSVVKGVEMAANSMAKRGQKADAAEQQGAFIENLNKLAAADKLLQRDPETFQTFIAAAAEDGPVQNVFIDGRTLMQSGMAPALADLSPAVREQLDRAILTGGMIAIPVDEYAARIAPTEFAPQLLDHLKTDAEGFSRAEAADYMANAGADLQAEVERVIGNQADADTFRTSQDVVKADILGQLNTAGRFTPQVNEAYATLASAYSAVRAAQLGMTPEAFHAERGMRVQGAAVAGQQFSQGASTLADVRAKWADDGIENFIAERDGTISLSQIVVPKSERGAGKGTSAMQALVDYADRTGQRVVLTPSSDFGGNKKRLTEFYKRFGFVENKGKNKDFSTMERMIREPKPADQSNQSGQLATDTPAFKAWFGDSRVVDADGKPLVVYHGTGEKFTVFDDEKSGRRGFYFAKRKDFADTYAKGDGANIIEAYVSIKNPISEAEFNAVGIENGFSKSEAVEFVKSQGYDGIIGPRAVVAFDPTQIKSAIGNSGTFDPADPNILNQSAILQPGGTTNGQPGRSPDVRSGQAEQELDTTVAGEPAAEGWAGATRIRGKSGEPVTVYRGAALPLDPGHFAAESLGSASGNPSSGLGVWFTTGRDEAASYGNVEPARLDIRNPKVIKVEELPGFDSVADAIAFRENLRGEGHDGIVITGRHLGKQEAHIVAFEPRQVVRQQRVLNQSANGSKQVAVTRLDSVFEGDHLKQAEQFYKKNVQGKTVDNPSIGQVRFSSEGLGKLLSGNRESALRASVVKVLPELMANAELTDLAVDRKWRGHVEGFKYLVAPLEHDGKLYAVRMAVKQGQQGGSFYTLEGFKADTLSALVGQNASYPGSEGTSSLNPTVRLDFLETEVNELNRVFQPDGGATTPRGAFSPATNTVTLLQNADLSTFLHESAHYFFESDINLASELLGKESLNPGEQQIVDDVGRLLTWHGIQGDVTEQLRQWHTMDFEEQRTHHERTAESFEAYLFSGQAPNLELQPIFQRFRAWMVNVYKSITDFLKKNPEAGKLNDEVRSVFDRMIATQEQIQLAEQARSLTALFASPETSGMTPDAYAAYQALGVDATNEAIQELQAKGLRDMQWLANARGRAVKKLQKESKAVRAEVTMEARGEVMRQPVYRAWDFLTRKLSDNDKLPPLERKSDPDVLDPTLDSLFVAIAKLGGIQKAQVLSEWGADPKDIPQSGLFGKPVWRVTEGLPIDSMASALAQHGYLPLNEHGQYELNDLGDRFLAELAGDTQYSHAYQPQDLLPGEQIANPAGLMAGRIEYSGLAAIGIPDEIAAHIKNLKMTATDGLHPDLVATLFEFSSGDELVRTLAAAQAPKDAITALAEQMMLERFGELSSPDAIERAADQAIHNDVRARMLATEVNALAQATGRPKILASAAKAFAADMIARLKVRDIRPGQYANAEARAAKAAAKAKGDIATAAAEKRNQIIQHYATRAAYDAQDEVKATMRAWSKLVARKDSTKSVDIDLLNAVRAILGEYGIAPKRAERASEYLKAVQAYDPEMYAVIQGAVERAEAHAKPVKELTLIEFRGLRDEIDSIMHLAKRSRQMEIDGDLLEIADIQDALVERMTGYGIPDTIPGEGQAVTPAEQRMNKFKSLLAFARRVESWVGQMDGTQAMGPFRRFVWSRISDAAVAYRVDKAAYMKQFRALVESIAPTLKPTLIHSPELGYTFGKDSGGSAINEILHAVLHTGNESNKRKMLLGRGWAVEVAPGQLDTRRWDAFIARLVAEGKLTQAHYDFAQGAWDLLDSMKPLAQKTHRDVFGRYFDEVTASPFTDPFGITRAGGYVPAMVDSRIVKDAELRKLADEDNAAMSYAFPTTPKGFTQARTEYNKPLMLDLRTLGQHVDKVLLFSHMEMPVREVQRVLSKRVGETLNRIDQTAISGMLLPWLNRSAKQQVETPIAGSAGTMRFFSVLRSHAGMAAMFGNLANTVQQLTGFALAAVQVKPGLLLSATADFTKAPREFAQAVSETSAYMNTRMANEVYAMTDAINDILLNPSQLEKGQAWTMRHAYFLQSAMDNSMSPIIWTAAYNQAKQGGETHADAVRLADGTVRQTQGAMQAEDISRIEGGNAFVRMFTQFAGYFNMNANLLGTEYVKLMHNGGLRKNAGRGVFLFVFGYMVPAVVGELIIQAFRGGPGDDDDDGEYLDDWLAAVFGWAPLRYATAMVPVGGAVTNAAVNAWNGKPYDDRISTSPAISMLESAARAPVSVYKAIDGDGSAQKAVRDTATLISMTLGLPANLAARPIGYGVGVLDEATEPTGGFDFTRGLLTGQVSPDSKQ